jgi:hypothetical protein
MTQPIRLTRRGRIAATIAATIAALGLATLTSADWDANAAPQPVQNPVQIDKAKKPAWKCNDYAAKVLHKAGFTGFAHKQAWAITWRESKHENLSESSPWFSGALGIWQIQTSAHSGKAWWSRSAMLNPDTQSRIVYKHMTRKGTYWRPWGLTPDGQLDASHYSGWSSWHWENWIMAPYRTGLSLYPCKTLPPNPGIVRPAGTLA